MQPPPGSRAPDPTDPLSGSTAGGETDPNPGGQELVSPIPMPGYDASTYGERFAPVYDRWYGDVSDVAGTVATMAALARSTFESRSAGVAASAAGLPSVLELGIGSGRLALPMAAAGLAVTGIDSSPSMLALLEAKPGADALSVLRGDMTEPDGLTAERFDAVLVAFNTFFNVASQAGQQRCFDGVARVLEPGGHFVLEAFVPSDEQPPAAVSPTQMTADHVVLTATMVDSQSQTIRGQHIDITSDGIALRPWFLRYASPAQLDANARQAGLELASRNSDWHQGKFDEHSLHHVSVYRKPG